MIEEIGKDTPLSFQECLALIEKDKVELENRKQSPFPYKPGWIYRGQSNSEWQLETTLERYLREELGLDDLNYCVEKYYRKIDAATPRLNVQLNKNFKRYSPKFKYEYYKGLPQPELLSYLRHLGFPSPLLDWSFSFYVAAFFAFRHAKVEKPVAIYAYKQWDGSARAHRTSDPIISELGPYIETHLRHFQQQAVYTYCIKDSDTTASFTNYQDVLIVNSQHYQIKKYVVDGKQKQEVMKLLQEMNINDYTIFGDDESLMRALAREVFLQSED
jgi:hypothetical protein